MALLRWKSKAIAMSKARMPKKDKDLMDELKKNHMKTKNSIGRSMLKTKQR